MSADAHQDARGGRGTAAPAGVAAVPTVDAAAVLASHTPRVFETSKRLGGLMECFEEVACSVCGREWGDAAAGGCEAVLLARETLALRERAERAVREPEIEEANRIETVDWAIRERQRMVATARVALLEGLLRSVEWVNTADAETLYCPRCGWAEEDGHSPACALGAALTDGG